MSKKQFMDAMSKLRSSKKGPILEKDYRWDKNWRNVFTKQEFIKYYGGLEEWNASVGYNDLFLPGKEDHDETASPTAASGSSRGAPRTSPHVLLVACQPSAPRRVTRSSNQAVSPLTRLG